MKDIVYLIVILVVAFVAAYAESKFGFIAKLGL